ncbi:CDP-archaeol synthase [uncultured archaeon]|nr:CDP-archaeol synthase [uncultured archaeon]
MLDFGKSFLDGRRVFRDGKTARGFFAGVFGGIVAGGILSFIMLSVFFTDARAQFIGFSLMALGTMLGDALGSFLKRRLGIEPGKPFILDQLMFLVVALVLVYPFVLPNLYSIENIVLLFVVTYVLHTGSNWAANKLGWKKVPW